MKKLLSVVLGLILLMSPLFTNTVEAESNKWDFDLATDYYVSDSYEIDISDGVAYLISRLTPTEQGFIQNQGITLLNYPQGIAVSGDFVYVVDRDNDGVEVINISGININNPIHESYISDNADRALNDPDDIVISGNYAYVSSMEGIEIIDISDPSNPSHAAAVFDDETTELLGSRGLSKSGDYLYVTAFMDNGFSVIDVSDPTTPVYLASISDDATTLLYRPTELVIDGNYAYISCLQENGIEILDISEPANPSHAAKISDSSSSLLRGLTSIAKKGDYLYVTSYMDHAFASIDVTNPLNPVYTDHIADGTDYRYELNGAYDIAFYGDYALIASNYDKGVEVVDISDPTDLKHEGSVDDTAANIYLNYPQNICVSGDYAFVTSDNTMQILNLDNIAYSSNKPYVQPDTPLNFNDDVLSFSMKYGSESQGEITYQISNDNGVNWYYYNNDTWNLTTANDGTETSSVSDVNENIHTLCTGGGQFLFRAFLNSRGNQKVELDQISVVYDVVPELTGISIKRLPIQPDGYAYFYTNANATGYIMVKVTDSPTPPESFDDAAITSIVYEEGLQEGGVTVTIPEGEQYLHMALKVGGTLSDIKTIHMPYDLYYYDDFEAFDTFLPGVTYPRSFNPLSPGSGAVEQKIIDDNGNQVFRLHSTNNMSMNGIATTAVTDGTIVYTMDVKPISGDTPVTIFVSSDAAPYSEYFAYIGMNEGRLYIQTDTGTLHFPETTYSFGEWNKLSLIFNDDDKVFSVMFNDIIVGLESYPYLRDVTTGAFTLVCGGPGINEVYVDNVTVYQKQSGITVTYDANGAAAGNVPTDSNVYNYQDEVIVSGNTGTLVKQGYTFNGWNTESDYTGTHYDVGDKFNIENSTTLYAQWKISSYKITYYANEASSGSVPVDSGVYKFEDPVTVKGNTGNLDKTGYTFTGWNTKDDGSGTHYDPNDVFDIVGHTALHAEWEKDSVVITPTPTPTPSVTPTPVTTETPTTVISTIAVSDIEVLNSNIQIELGSSEIIEYTIIPENATDKSVIWSSLDDRIASVENGVVTANEVGITVITITANDSDGTVSKTVTVEVIATDDEDDSEVATPEPEETAVTTVDTTEDTPENIDSESDDWILYIGGFGIIAIIAYLIFISRKK